MVALRTFATLSAWTLAAGAQRSYTKHTGVDCYEGYGGTAIDPSDTPLSNKTVSECQAECDTTKSCVAVTHDSEARSKYQGGDCWRLSAVELSKCDTSSRYWDTYTVGSSPPSPSPTPTPGPTPPAKNETVQVVHLFERKFTGLADKDAADFEGEVKFIFLTFNPKEATNPEAAIGENIFEMSTVEVTGWGEYQPCNAPGCTGLFTCPADGGYCCTEGHSGIANNTKFTLPGRKVASGGGGRRRRKATDDDAVSGYWYSFPKESEGTTWTEVSIDRRINSSCLAEAWRADAGGCSECDDLASQCVGNCIQQALIKGNDSSALRATWDRVWNDKVLCPDVPFPDGTLPGSPFVV